MIEGAVNVGLEAVIAASVDWSGSERGVAVHEADSVSLVGMALLDGHALNIDVRQGGRVLIESAAV